MISMYKIHFYVLKNDYETKFLFDQRGMEVPVKTQRGVLMVKEEDEKFSEMVPPFTPVDREVDYQEAWSHFERVLKEKSK